MFASGCGFRGSRANTEVPASVGHSGPVVSLLSPDIELGSPTQEETQIIHENSLAGELKRKNTAQSSDMMFKKIKISLGEGIDIEE